MRKKINKTLSLMAVVLMLLTILPGGTYAYAQTNKDNTGENSFSYGVTDELLGGENQTNDSDADEQADKTETLQKDSQNENSGNQVAVVTRGDKTTESFDSFQGAIDASENDDTILLKKSVSENINIDNKTCEVDLGGFQIKPDSGVAITITGGDVKVINGTITGGTGTKGAGIVVEGGSLEGSKLTIENNTSEGNGAGVYSTGTVKLTGCKVTGNKAAGYGAGIYSEGKLSLVNCNVDENTTSGSSSYGGAVMSFGTLSIEGGSFSNNTSKYGAALYVAGVSEIDDATIAGNKGYAYGAVAIGGTTVTMTGCKVKENTSDCWGSGIYVGDGGVLVGDQLIISDNDFTTVFAARYRIGGGIYSNVATSEITLKGSSIVSDNKAYYGAGIYTNGTLTVEDSVISGNVASNNGGGIFTYKGGITIKNSDITGNKSSNNGGGIYASAQYNGGTKNYVDIAGSNFTGNSAVKGGAVFTEVEPMVTTIDDCTFEKNVATREGGALYLTNSSTVTNSVFQGNDSKVTSGAAVTVYTTDTRIKTVFDGCQFKDNISSGAREIFYVQAIQGGVSPQINNCTFEDNSAGRVMSITGTGTADINNTKLVDNTSSEATIYLGVAGTCANFTSCLIEGNTGGAAGGILMETTAVGKITLKDTVIKDNSATDTSFAISENSQIPTSGGICLASGNVNLVSGAVYDNHTVSDSKSNDWSVATGNNVGVSIIDADSMSDGDMDFSKYVWTDTSRGMDIETEIAATSPSKEYYLTAKVNSKRVVALIGDTKYYTLEDAVDAAGDGDTIKLVAGDYDEVGTTLTSEPMRIVKDITIDFNGRTVNHEGASSESLFTVENGSKLSLVGDGTIIGNLGVEPGGSLSLDGDLNFKKITHMGDSLKLNGEMGEVKVSLGEGCTVDLGDDFSCDSLTLTVSDATVKEFSNGASGAADELLVTGATQEILDKTSVANISSPLVSLVLAGSSLFLHEEVVTGVFVDGVDGDDDADGSYEHPVKTFQQAKVILQKTAGIRHIYVVGAISVKGDETWSLDDDEVLARYPSYTGNLAIVENSGSLTLENIVIDGAKDYGVTDANSMIKLESYSKLIINEGTVLRNNDVSDHGTYMFDRVGGAVSTLGMGEITMNGGRITGCSAWEGGAIYAGDGATFTMNGGSIDNNSCYKSSNANIPAGGGVMVDGAGHMYLNDGIITGNSAGYGGGVALGGNYVIKNYNRVENFTMKGGQITENYASTDGGGMFVQCSMTASIHEGDLTDNTCGRGGNFGGGAIYVNGGRLEKYGYEDGVLNLYDAVITNNTAGMEGGGFAGCMTSSTYTNLTEGAAIYGNTADGEKDDILVSNSNGAGNISNANPAKSISEYMLGGAPYLWKYVGSGDSVGINYLKEPGAINIYTDEIAAGEKASSLAKVHITGNTAGLRGGGIGSNGTVIIGSTLSTLEEVKNITVTKQWVDDSDAAGLRPSTVWVWLLRNGERVSCLEFRDDVIDGGSLTFNNLEVDDENGEPYEYTIEEDMTGMDGVYKSIVSDPTIEGIDEEYTITNKLITSGDLSVSKVIEGNGASAHDEFTFKVTLADNTINGTYGDMEFVDGVATFKLHGGESITAKDLPKNIEYTVEETDSLDYKSTINGEDADQASGKVVGNNIQDVVFINTKDVPPGDTPTQKSPNNPTPTSVSTEGAPGGITLTGDRLNIGLWLILLIICGAAIVEVLAYGRKKKRIGKK